MVKEGSRGVKSAYKDLKSKLRDITPPKSQFHISASSPNDTDVSDSQHHQRHHSAPNSPVFLKRGLNNDLSLEAGRKPFSSYTQSSNSHAAKNGFTLYASQHVMHNNNNINLSSCNSPMNKSPTVSPSSSLCSSDMNISQELQNHPLFKSPNVDRSPPKSNPEIVKDLISLDESNSSFDLSDLDPLNQNAKPIPGLLSQSASFTSNMKATTLPSTSNTTFSISNPLYPEFIPRLRNESPQTTVINPPRDSESELLRQYGLDKFNLINGSATTLATGQQTADPKRNWTTFD